MMQVIAAFDCQLDLSSLLTHQGTSQFNPHLHGGTQEGKNSSCTRESTRYKIGNYKQVCTSEALPD